MRLLLFLTLVLIQNFATASPDSNIPPENIDTKPLSKWEQIGDPLVQTRVHHPKMLMFTGGEALGTLVDQDQNISSFLIGMGQIVERAYASDSMELELTQTGLGGGCYRRHWAFYSGRSFEFNYSAGIGALFKPQEQLGSFINFQRYQGRAGVGLTGQSGILALVNFDFQVGLATLGPTFYLKLSYLIPD